MKADSEVLQVSSRRQWRSWLDEHHETTSSILLVIHKEKYRADGIGLDDAVEEALCFGWIDSQLHRLDEKRYLLTFTPRRPDSIWSIRNIQRAKRLMDKGQMAPAGMRAVEEAKRDGAWETAVRREETDTIPDELARALRRRKGAIAGYRALTDSRKKQLLHWLFTAKRDETRASRIAAIVSEALGEDPPST